MMILLKKWLYSNRDLQWAKSHYLNFFCDFLSDSSSQTLPSERRRDQLCIMVCVRLPHHGADADAGLVLAAVPLRRLQVSLFTKTPKHNPWFHFDLPVRKSYTSSHVTASLHIYNDNKVSILDACVPQTCCRILARVLMSRSLNLLWLSFVAACGRRGVAARSSRRRSEQRTKLSEMRIGVWGRWVTERSASWGSSSSWWRCGSRETRASWTAGPPTSSTPKPSEYHKHSICCCCCSAHTDLWDTDNYIHPDKGQFISK